MDDIYTDLQFLTTMLTSWDGIKLDGEDTNKGELIRSIGKDYMDFALSILRIEAGDVDFDTDRVCRMFRIDADAEELNDYIPDAPLALVTNLTLHSQTLRTAIFFDAEFSKDENVPVMGALVIDLYERIYDELVGIYDDEAPVYRAYSGFIGDCRRFFDLFSLPAVKKKLEKQG